MHVGRDPCLPVPVVGLSDRPRSGPLQSTRIAVRATLGSQVWFTLLAFYPVYIRIALITRGLVKPGISSRCLKALYFLDLLHSADSGASTGPAIWAHTNIGLLHMPSHMYVCLSLMICFGRLSW